jgi:dCTP deaminase
LILCKPDIIRYIEEERLVISPEVPRDAIDQVSIDLRLGRKFTTFKAPEYLGSIRADPSVFQSLDLWERNTADTFDLKPGELVLAHTLETIRIPPDLVGLVEGRSSWARLGVSIHITAPKIDPGFHGTITLEMANLGKATVQLRAERDRPAQLMLMTVSQPLDETELYGAAKDDIFQGQDEPIPRRR